MGTNRSKRFGPGFDPNYRQILWRNTCVQIPNTSIYYVFDTFENFDNKLERKIRPKITIETSAIFTRKGFIPAKSKYLREAAAGLFPLLLRKLEIPVI